MCQQLACRLEGKLTGIVIPFHGISFIEFWFLQDLVVRNVAELVTWKGDDIVDTSIILCLDWTEIIRCYACLYIAA